MPGDLPSPVWSVGCSGGGGRRPATWISSAVSLVPLIVPTGVTAHTLVRTSGRGRLAEDRSDGASRPGGGHYFVRKIGSSSTPPLPPETQRMPTRMSACRGANLPLPLSVTRCKAGKPRTSARGNTLASCVHPLVCPLAHAKRRRREGWVGRTCRGGSPRRISPLDRGVRPRCLATPWWPTRQQLNSCQQLPLPSSLHCNSAKPAKHHVTRGTATLVARATAVGRSAVRGQQV